MYVCVCNALNERAVRDAVNRGATTPGQVYRALGVKPRCGKCADMISGMAPPKHSGAGCTGCGKCAKGRAMAALTAPAPFEPARAT